MLTRLWTVWRAARRLCASANSVHARTGEPACVTLHTVDARGNARAAGGEAVAASLRGGPPRAVPASVDAAVTDNADGTYGLAFALPAAGLWELAAAVGGAPVPAPPTGPLVARHGRLTAAECEVVGLEPGETVACGSTDPIFIQARPRCGARSLPPAGPWRVTSVARASGPLATSRRAGGRRRPQHQ